MSNAVFGLGLYSYNNNAPTGQQGQEPQYASWKGTGQYSNPVAVTAGNQRPLTNKDPTNNAPYRHGLPRPQKWQYRRATQTKLYNSKPSDTNANANVSRSSTGGNLINQLIFTPGSFKVLQNPPTEKSETTQLNKDCSTCTGIGLVADYYPFTDLTENPQPVTTNPPLCCNDQRKALKHVRSYGNTLLKKNYYQTTKQYLQNRCQTYEQRAFNFYAGPITSDNVGNIYSEAITNPESIVNAKPGSPLIQSNFYVAQCFPSTCNSIPGLSGQPDNTSLSCLNPTINPNILQPYPTPVTQSKGCKLVVYKPSNSQFAVEGAVESSARTLRLGITTLEKNIVNTRRLQGATSVNTLINLGGKPFTPFVYKAKTQTCQPGLPFYWQGNVQTNPKTCIPLDPVINQTNSQQNPNYSKLGQVYAGPNWATNGVSTNWSGISQR